MKVNKKSVSKAPVTKASAAKASAAKASAAKAAPARRVILACIGSRGLVLSAGAMSGDVFTPARDCNGATIEGISGKITLGEAAVVAWKGKGSASAFGKSLGAYASPAGEKVRVMELTSAIKSGDIKVISLRDGKKTVDGYFLRAWNSKQALPQYVGALNAGGRLEPYAHPAGRERQAGFDRQGLTVA